ncbi:MAG: chromate transporter [Nitrospirota bacterium]
MVGLRRIFLVFLKIGAFAFGGVYSMLSFYQRELVDRRGWLTQEDFAEGVAIGQMTPGPPIINTGIYAGYRLRGLKGAISAVLGVTLPGFIIVVALAWLYMKYRYTSIFSPVLKGLGAAVVGLLLSVVLRLGKGLIKKKLSYVISAACFVLFYFFKANPVLLIGLAGVSGWFIYGRR